MAEVIEAPYKTWGDVKCETTCDRCLAVLTYLQKETYDRVNPNDRPGVLSAFYDPDDGTLILPGIALVSTSKRG